VKTAAGQIVRPRHANEGRAGDFRVFGVIRVPLLLVPPATAGGSALHVRRLAPVLIGTLGAASVRYRTDCAKGLRNRALGL
jgi:hypothetical protein